MSVNPIIAQSLMEQIAALSLTGVAEYKIAEQLGITRYKAGKIMKSPEFKAHLKDISDQATALALAAFKNKMEFLEPLAFEALRHNLQEKKLDAVKVWGTFVGIGEKSDGKGDQVGNLQVFLPGAVQPAEIKDVRSEVIDADNQSDRQDQ